MLDATFLTNRWGPLPAWAWMGLGLGGAIAVASWQRNKAGVDGDVIAQKYELPDSLQPSYVFQNYDQDQTWITVPEMPPAGGRPPGSGPRVQPMPGPPSVEPVPSPVVPAPGKPPPKAPAGKWVTVTKYNGKRPPWSSTLWGIAQKLYGNGASWRQIWDAPQNAAVKKKRGHPEKIQPGDRFWVPTK